MPAKKMKITAPPETEFVLIFLGGVLVMADSIIAPVTNLGFGASVLAQYFEFVGIFIGLLMIICAMLIYTTEANTRRTFATGTLIFSVLSLLTGGGFLGGFIIGTVGSVFLLRSKN